MKLPITDSSTIPTTLPPEDSLHSEDLVKSMMITILRLLDMHKHTITIQAHSANELTELGNMIIRIGTRNGIYLTGWQNSKNTRTITFQDSNSQIILQISESEGGDIHA